MPVIGFASQILVQARTRFPFRFPNKFQMIIIRRIDEKGFMPATSFVGIHNRERIRMAAEEFFVEGVNHGLTICSINITQQAAHVLERFHSCSFAS